APDAPHFIARMTESGQVRLCFGDGVNGRRLPTGHNNIQVQYRRGNGPGGNLPASSFTDPAQPHALVQAVCQPFAASGGSPMETAHALKHRAPATVLTLDRAVSTRDFAHMAQAHSSILQARATLVSPPDSHLTHIHVVVVPAGGQPLEENPDLKVALETHLSTHALPFTRVHVSSFTPVPAHLSIELRALEPGYRPVRVEAELRLALMAAFSLEKRKLGQALTLSEVYQLVEETPGVRQSVCRISGHGHEDTLETTQVTPPPRGLAFLDPKDSNILISTQGGSHGH
ncbi:MAG: baseplate J/gp47 family protein, partial [Chromatiales bacterium]|nr:baseplate J/gp47 family protein [Chromatiales bacterium]